MQVHGGGPFSDPRIQGFGTGLLWRPNGLIDQGSEEEQKEKVLSSQERIMAAIGGNLRDFEFQNRDGETIRGLDAVRQTKQIYNLWCFLFCHKTY